MRDTGISGCAAFDVLLSVFLVFVFLCTSRAAHVLSLSVCTQATLHGVNGLEGAQQIHVRDFDQGKFGEARFMESFESRHSDHSFTAAVVGQVDVVDACKKEYICKLQDRDSTSSIIHAKLQQHVECVGTFRFKLQLGLVVQLVLF